MRPTIWVSLVAVGLRPFSRSTWPVAATANGEIITASTTVASRTWRVRGDFIGVPPRSSWTCRSQHGPFSPDAARPAVDVRTLSLGSRRELHDQEPAGSRGLGAEVRLRGHPGGALRPGRPRGPADGALVPRRQARLPPGLCPPPRGGR